MKVFEKRQQDGSRKLMGTMTTVGEATEVTLKTKDGTSSTFDFSKQYHYVAPGSFAVNGTDDALGMYIGEDRVVPPAYIDFEEESDSEVPDTPDDHDTPESTITLTAIEVTTLPTKTVYNQGEELDLTGMVVTLIGTDGTQEVTETAGVDEYLTDPANGTVINIPPASFTDGTHELEVVVSAYDLEDRFTVTVNAAPETPDNGNA